MTTTTKFAVSDEFRAAWETRVSDLDRIAANTGCYDALDAAKRMRDLGKIWFGNHATPNSAEPCASTRSTSKKSSNDKSLPSRRAATKRRV